MVSSVIVLLVSFLCHYVIAGRTCPKPQEVPFSTVLPLKLSYEPGEQIVYVCKPGYMTQWGTRRYTCPLTGMWPPNSMKCLPRVCPFAGILENGAVSYTSFQYPNSVNFTCNKGFYLNGTASAKCMEDGKWNPPLPTCSPITCPPPPIPNFSTLKLHKTSVENSSRFQDTAVFECLPHYAMFGNDTIRCTEHGNWTELPECKEVKCPFPTRPDNGFVNYPARFALYYKDKATYGCHETYVLDGPKEVECEKSGTWSASPTCKASCKIPVKKATVLYKGEKVNIQDKFKNGILHGEIISFFCKNKERKCSYTVDAQCLNGNIEIPACFKEHSSWAFWKTDAADKEPC